MPQLRRTPWYAVDVDVRKDERIADLPSDAARWGYVGAVLAEARLQTQRGVFGSRATLLEAIGRFGRYVPAYLSGGLLEEAPNICQRCRSEFGSLRSGAIVVHNWARKQNDPGHADRQETYRGKRERDADGDASSDAKVTATDGERDALSDGKRTAYSRARAETETVIPLGTDKGVSPSARPDLVALVELHRWRRVTKAQRAILDELAEYERLSQTDVDSGYAVVASWIRETPDGEDPLQYAIACGKRRRAERQVAAGEADQRWQRQKADDRATAPERLGSILERTNGAAGDEPSDTAETSEAPEVDFGAPSPQEATARPRGGANV